MPKKDVVKLPETPPVWDPDLMATIDKVIGPDFTDDPLVRRYNLCCDSKLQGKLYKLTMSSKDSTIYPGVATVKDALLKLDDAEQRLVDHEHYLPFGGVAPFKGFALNASTPEISEPQAYTRQLEVFVPEVVDTSQASPFMIFLDGLNVFEGLGHIAPVFRLLRKSCGCCCSGAGGTAAASISFVKTMDNLFRAKQLEPMVCIFLNPGGTQDENCIVGSQRNLEYDSVSSTLTDFVEQEVLPFVSEKCNLKLSPNPDHRAVMGASSSGNAAITMGLTGRFKRILVTSPSCVNVGYPYNPQAPLQGWDQHSGKELIKNQPRVEGLRVVVVTNEFDLWYHSDVKYNFNWVAASLRTAKALKEKGYACLHVFAKQGIHIDPRALAEAFPDAVKWVWSDTHQRPPDDLRALRGEAPDDQAHDVAVKSAEVATSAEPVEPQLPGCPEPGSGHA